LIPIPGKVYTTFGTLLSIMISLFADSCLEMINESLYEDVCLLAIFF